MFFCIVLFPPYLEEVILYKIMDLILREALKKYEEIETYDTEDVTENIIEAFKDFKKGKIHPARDILNELKFTKSE